MTYSCGVLPDIIIFSKAEFFTYDEEPVTVGMMNDFMIVPEKLKMVIM